MKSILKGLFVLILLCSSFIISGCDDPVDQAEEFLASNYDFGKSWEYKESLDLSQALEALTNATQEMATVKAYSYLVTAEDTFDMNSYIYSGAAKINLNGTTPLVFMEFSGDLEFSFYIVENVVYVGHGQNKFHFSTNNELDNLVDILGVEIDFEMEEVFSSALLTATSFQEATLNNDEAIVIKFKEGEQTTTIVIHDNKIAVVLIQELFLEMRYVYDYNEPVISIPDDLSEYTALE